MLKPVKLLLDIERRPRSIELKAQDFGVSVFSFVLRATGIEEYPYATLL